MIVQPTAEKSIEQIIAQQSALCDQQLRAYRAQQQTVSNIHAHLEWRKDMLQRAQSALNLTTTATPEYRAALQAFEEAKHWADLFEKELSTYSAALPGMREQLRKSAYLLYEYYAGIQ